MYFSYKGFWVTVNKYGEYFDVMISHEYVDSSETKEGAIKIAIRLIEHMTGDMGPKYLC